MQIALNILAMLDRECDTLELLLAITPESHRDEITQVIEQTTQTAYKTCFLVLEARLHEYRQLT